MYTCIYFGPWGLFLATCMMWNKKCAVCYLSHCHSRLLLIILYWSVITLCQSRNWQLHFFLCFFLTKKKKTLPCLPQSSSAHHQPQVVEVVKIPGNQSVKFKSLTTEFLFSPATWRSIHKCQLSNYEKPCVADKLHCLPHSSTLRDGGGDLKRMKNTKNLQSGKRMEEICARSQISF